MKNKTYITVFLKLGSLFKRDEDDDENSDTRNVATSEAPKRGFFAAAQRTVLAPINGFGKAFVGLVTSVNSWVQRGFIRRVALLLTLTGGAFYLTYAFWPKVEYLPTGNRNLVFGILLPPPGYNLD